MQRMTGAAAGVAVMLALAFGAVACSSSKNPDSPASDAAAIAPAAAEAAAAEAAAEQSGLRKIAILPVAYVAADGGGYACDLCPPAVTMQPTSAQAARLVTAFFYENVARHPRLLTARYEPVAAAAARGMRAAASELAARGQADAVLIAALVALRPRVGDDDHPERPAGAALYAALVDSRSGAVIWSGTFDEDEEQPGSVRRLYGKLVGGVPYKWHSAEGFTEVAVKDLVEDLVDEVID